MQKHLGDPIPRLWCPPITHYTDTGAIDRVRMAAHWRHLSSHVGGLLVPGSTGDGWEMDESEIDALLDIALDLAVELDVRILIAALKPTVDEMVGTIEHHLKRLSTRTGSDDVSRALQLSLVAGFTVCPPVGKGLSQDEIRGLLEQVLVLNVPTALYQLPQVTGNEMSPKLVADLARGYPNLMMLKDTSGTDSVAQADGRQNGLYLMRGAEGSYASWLREAGGPYDGFLVSTANCLAVELHRIIKALESGDQETALIVSEQVGGVVAAVFDLVASLPYGNPFSNANKAMDHWMAYGNQASEAPMPVGHCGEPLPADLVANVGKVLSEAGFLPDTGYLEA